MSIADANLSIYDDGDTSKIFKFQASGIATGTTRTITVPDSSGTMTLNGAVQTISGAKTFNDATLKLAGATSGTSTLKAAAIAGTTTMTLPSATTTLIGTDTTDVLTNKSISGATNTLTVIPVSALNSGTGASSSTFWRGDGTWAAPSGGGTPQVVYEPGTGVVARWNNQSSGAGSSLSLDGSGRGLVLNKGTTTTGASGVTTSGLNNTYLPYYDLNATMTALAMDNSTIASNTWTWFTGIGGVTGAPTTQKHYGFIIKNNNGTRELYATNGNGTTQTSTQINTYTSNEIAGFNSYFIVFVPATSIKFYVNRVLAATHLTNIPSGALSGSNFMNSTVLATAGTTATACTLAHFAVGFDAY